MTIPTPTDDTYHRFFKLCLGRRVSISEFETLFQQLHTRHPLSSSALTKHILSPTLIHGRSDPLHLEILQWLLTRDHLSASQVLAELLRTSGLTTPTTSPPIHREALEQDVFLVLVHSVAIGKPRAPESIWTVLHSLTIWMDAILTTTTTTSDSQILTDAISVHHRGRIETLGELVIAFATQEDVIKLLSQPGGKRERTAAFLAALEGFLQCVQVFGVLVLVPRLEELREMYVMKGQRREEEVMEGIVMGLGDAQAGVCARAHLYVWLSSLLAGVPNVEENYVVGYLLSRYKDSTPEMVTDFMTAVIDVVAHAVHKKEPPATLMLLRSFLVNKIPLILLRLSQYPQILSGAISQAFLRADTGALQDISPSRFDPYSLRPNDTQDMFDPENMNVDLRSDFLFACALHGIVDESEITTMLGELPVSAMSASGKYTVELLQEQYHANHDRADRLLEEIESMEGNAGAVCRTLFEIMKGMCETRATMPLRNFCSFLTRKTSSIDIMLLFVKSSELLEPLCDLLDTWRYEEDQGEYQPVYEEFGSILLFVFTVIRRYNLPISSLYVTHPLPQESFLATLLTIHDSPIDSLPPDRYTSLGGWIKELFELEGISDSLMSSCSPQEFYYLVPTLFTQTLAAYQQGVLDKEIITEAFGFLLQPFLLPSIVAGLQVISTHLWANITNPSTALALLAPLILTGDSLTAETAEAHRTAISIPARQLCTVLTTVIHHLQSHPQQQPEQPENLTTALKLLSRLRPLQHFTRSSTPSKDELDGFVQHGSTIAQTLTTSFTLLATWQPSAPSPPPAVFSMKLLTASRFLLGPRKMLRVLLQACVDVIQLQPGGARQGEAEDVLAAVLMCYLPVALAEGGGLSSSSSSSSSSMPLLDTARLVLGDLQSSPSTAAASSTTPAPPAPPATAPQQPGSTVPAPAPQQKITHLSLLHSLIPRIDAHLSSIDELGRTQPQMAVVAMQPHEMEMVMEGMEGMEGMGMEGVGVGMDAVDVEMGEMGEMGEMEMMMMQQGMGMMEYAEMGFT
ncbi:Med5-domain-containing protein [Ascodesmis nigricans]|uniref:Mediator of RNA polymerase II transcription subunit 5 n=1 Tax=Ascodesmis nigricans TaxID=341454 RepID=A0A4S2MV06_9PEZI|nr:Med5-domain-containing protein [Ascodesmis nigricans]